MPESKLKNTISNTLNQDTLRRMAGQIIFERGENYFGRGKVASLLEYQGMIIARVSGNDL
ncbi:MAG: hypothetical protein K940chlam3_01590 [Chlamydiae bacterium]|nr:hypothetical protein [Chlamydiota bacterium]